MSGASAESIPDRLLEAAIHLEGAGDIDFEDGNTFLLKELEIGWDKLILRLGIDLPTIPVGRFCVLRFPDDVPFVGGECIYEFPGIELFTASPDIGPVKLNFNAIVQYIVTEISGRFTIEISKDGDYVKVFADVEAIDVDPISINDTFGKLPAILQAGVVTCAALIVSKVPQVWLLDFVLGILGLPSVTTWVLNLLDLEDDLSEWLMDKLNFSIGIDNLIYQAIFDAVLKKSEVFKIDDPYPFVPEITAKLAQFGGFINPQPVGPSFKIPETSALIINPSAVFTDHTLWIKFDFGL